MPRLVPTLPGCSCQDSDVGPGAAFLPGRPSAATTAAEPATLLASCPALPTACRGSLPPSSRLTMVAAAQEVPGLHAAPGLSQQLLDPTLPGLETGFGGARAPSSGRPNNGPTTRSPGPGTTPEQDPGGRGGPVQPATGLCVCGVQRGEAHRRSGGKPFKRSAGQ